MSLASVSARIDQLEGRVAPAAARPAATTTDFGAQLATATAATAGAPIASAASAGGNEPYAAEIDAAASRYGIDPNLLRGLVGAESGFNPNARSAAGAVGLTQLMPSTAAALGVTDPTDPAQSLDGGARYLRQQLDAFGGDPAKALAAYNAGPAAVRRFGGVPPYGETQAYVARILGDVAGQAAAPQTLPSIPGPGASVGSLPYKTT
jgi:soluble lytic murein transglycosylase-like protein